MGPLGHRLLTAIVAAPGSAVADLVPEPIDRPPAAGAIGRLIVKGLVLRIHEHGEPYRHHPTEAGRALLAQWSEGKTQ